MSPPSIAIERDNLLTVSELASLLKVPQKTVYHWVSHLGIPHIKIGKHLRFNSGKVLKFFEKKTGS